MQINVSQQLKEPIGSVRVYNVNEVMGVAGEINSRLVQGKVRLTRTNRGILVKGMLHTEIEATCDRCLTLFVCSFTMNIEEEYFPTADVFTGTPMALPEGSGDFTIDKWHILDLTEAIRQYTLLSMPMKPLCREDCAGLCPQCGCDLNQGPCSCLAHHIDPRWAELSKVLSSKQKGIR